MIPPRGCAYIVMIHRQDAYRALQKLSRGPYKVNQKAIKVSDEYFITDLIIFFFFFMQTLFKQTIKMHNYVKTYKVKIFINACISIIFFLMFCLRFFSVFKRRHLWAPRLPLFD